VPTPALVATQNTRPAPSPSPSLLSDMSASTSLTTPSVFSASSVSSSSTKTSLPTLESSFYPEPRIINASNIASSPPISEFKVPTRPTSSLSELQNPIGSTPYAIPQISRPATSSSFFPLTGIDLSQNSTRPAASVYITQMEREVCERPANLRI